MSNAERDAAYYWRIQDLEAQLAVAERDRDRWAARVKKLEAKLSSIRTALNANIS